MKGLLVVLVFAASAAYGEIYRWIDFRGTVHYTNNMDEIPVRSRARVKVLNYETEKKPDASSTIQNGLAAQAMKPEQHPAVPQAGRLPIQQNAPVPQAVVNRGKLQQQREQGRREDRKSKERQASPYREE